MPRRTDSRLVIIENYTEDWVKSKRPRVSRLAASFGSCSSAGSAQRGSCGYSRQPRLTGFPLTATPSFTACDSPVILGFGGFHPPRFPPPLLFNAYFSKFPAITGPAISGSVDPALGWVGKNFSLPCLINFEAKA